MQTIQTIAVIASLLATFASVEAQIIPRFQRTRPCLLNGIPNGNYATSTRSISKRVLSLPAIASDPVVVETEVAEEPAQEAVQPQPVGPISTDGTDGRVRSAMNLPALDNRRGSIDPSAALGDLMMDPVLLGLGEFREFDVLRTRDLSQAEQTKVFTFKPTSLQIDHCQISEMSVYLQSNGSWTVSLRAEHNAAAIPGQANASFLRQNQYVVSVRCLGERRFGSTSVRNRPTVERRNATVITTLGPIEFYVKSGEPRTIVANSEDLASRDSFDARSSESITTRDRGERSSLARRFAQIDHVELEFFYRGKSLKLPIHRVAQ